MGAGLAGKERFTADAREAYLQVLRETCHHQTAALRAGVAIGTVHYRRNRDPGFAAAVKVAEEEGACAQEERHRDRALRRAGAVTADGAPGDWDGPEPPNWLKGWLKRRAAAAQAAAAAPRTRAALEAELLARLTLLAARTADEGAPDAAARAAALAQWPDLGPRAAGDWRAILDVAGRAEDAWARSVGRRKPEVLERWDGLWPAWAHAGQLPPAGDWTTWLLLAGRGFGKTRAGAEWVNARAAADGALRIALVGGTEADVVRVMIEGQSGVANVGPPDARPRLRRGELRWPSGARGFIYSGANPEALRGPEHGLAWCDEIAKWARAEDAWSNLMLGLRLGRAPRALVTTTPRPTPLLRRLVADAGVVRTGGASGANRALPPAFLAEVERLWGGTRLGRQELGGEMLEDVAGSLWPRALIERQRVDPVTPLGQRELVRVAVGVDPPASADGDACGIVAVGLHEDGRLLVLEDASVRGLSPEGWARAVRACAERWGADRVAAEANQGGDMVRSVLEGAGAGALPVRLVHATRGKTVRAEPVSALYERGMMAHAGAFPELEDELAGFTPEGYRGPGRSPDRADALVWATTELTGGRARAEPRVMWL